ncbi:MAG TPA: PilZ domain-containing protein [Acidimicrobiia bacterium]|nr:PilZ domain-containing protein [Acidimicrobiia bacterium]
MRELEIGEQIIIEDFRCVVVWQGNVSRAGGNLLVLTGEQAPPVDLKPNAPVRVCFSEQRWLTKVRGRVLEREERTLKILLVGQGERVQRRGHVRVAVSQPTQVTITHQGGASRVIDAEVVDISEGGCQLRADSALSGGDLVQLDCNLDGTTIRLTGQVVHVWRDTNRYVAGVRTMAISSGARSVISRFVISRSLATARADTVAGRRRTPAR